MFRAKYISALIYALTFLLFLLANTTSAGLSDSLLVMHYFDDLIDDSGNGHDLVLGGDAYLLGDDLLLDGDGDYADIGPDTFGPNNPCGGDSDYTIAIQYYHENEASGYCNGNGTILDIGAEHSDSELLVLTNDDSQYVEIEDTGSVGDEEGAGSDSFIITYNSSSNTFTLWAVVSYRCGRGCVPFSYAQDAVDYSADYSTYIPRLGSIHDASDYFNDIYTDLEGDIDFFAIWNRILSEEEMQELSCSYYSRYQVSEPSPRGGGIVHDEDIKLNFRASEEAICIAEPNLLDPEVDANNYLQGAFTYDVYWGKYDDVMEMSLGGYPEPNLSLMTQLADDYAPAECNDLMTFDPLTGSHEPGTTYAWIVDINDHNDAGFKPGPGPGDPCLYPGPVFTYTTWGVAELISPSNGEEDVDTGTIELLFESDGYAADVNIFLLIGEEIADSNLLTPEANSWTPNVALGFGGEYAWYVEECNTVGAEEICVQTEVWTFTTGSCGTIDDFESYTDLSGTGQAWKDWYDDTATDNAVINELNSTNINDYIYNNDPNYLYPGDENGQRSMRVCFDRNYMDNIGDPQEYDDFTWREYSPSIDLVKDGGKSVSVACRPSLTDGPVPADDFNLFMGFSDDDANEVNIDYSGDVSDPNWSVWYVTLSEIADGGVDPCNITEIRLGGTGTADVGAAEPYFFVYFDLLVHCGPICRTDSPSLHPPADFTGPDGDADCIVDEWELKLLSDQWLTDPNTEPNADLYIDQFIDLKDYGLLADEWMNMQLWPE
ncbi:MAG: hypothetical protein ACYSSP_05545 [Planctomycetota bacterium]|jgi:hypothetical protein